ncbi:MAG: sigma-54-dependent Fis family transcriptional regulator [Planctomycetes bacterium]|nr:sigma-54-dependent Fis family transcriptional regulator [Planctomycetota bacterium]
MTRQDSNFIPDEQVRTAKVLLIESDPAQGQSLRVMLAEAGAGIFDVVHAGNMAQAVKRLEDEPFDAVLLDLFDGDLEALGQIRRQVAQMPIVVLADADQEEQAIAATSSDAQDYLLKGRIGPDLLARAIRYAIQRKRPAAADRLARYFSYNCPAGVPLVGKSPAIVRMLETVRMIGRSRCNPVLLLGETGTGKELVAQAVHAWRCDAADPFVAINCAALTVSLLESELFGHTKGSFTGADREKTGLLELAGTGSIFMDEISEIPPELQAKLLRVLQERMFRKVGGTKSIPCAATIIASSNRDLLREVEAGRFRRDLYYRLAVFPVHLPALRSPERREDIPLLAEFFAETSTICEAGPRMITPPAIEALCRHDWPGNVRELRNVIERAMIIERTDKITPESLMPESHRPAAAGPFAHPTSQQAGHQPPASPSGQTQPQGQPPSAFSPQPFQPAFGTSAAPTAPQAAGPAAPTRFAPPAGPMNFSLEAAERELIIRALQETGWQRTRAATMLGITRATLHAKLKRYDIKTPDKSD